ncbi:MAG TPA: hypothetical protein P5228_02150 [Bacteroidales bacterium]|nr:hypothetical protein [Bacteroidales bacterium]HRZ50042.1 hypothetical protein [Bacteroidales bacterium]
MEETNTLQEQECCPPFHPETYHEQVLSWNNKLFVRTRVRCLFYMPLNFGAKMRRLVPRIEKAGISMPEGMVLSDHTSPWSMDLLIAIDKVLPGTENVTLTGSFVARVYEGSFSETGKWFKEFNTWVKDKGYQVKKIYTWYTTCPKCAKKYGKNYVVLLGEVV